MLRKSQTSVECCGLRVLLTRRRVVVASATTVALGLAAAFRSEWWKDDPPQWYRDLKALDWPGRRRDFDVAWNANLGNAVVTGGDLGLVQIWTTPTRPYRLAINLAQPDLWYEVGVFLGYREVGVGDSRHAEFQRIGISARALEADGVKSQYEIVRELTQIHPSGSLVPLYRPGDRETNRTFRQDIPRPKAALLPTLGVVADPDDGLREVTWDDNLLKPLQNLTTDAANRRFRPDDYVGVAGIYCVGTAWFRNPQIHLVKETTT